MMVSLAAAVVVKTSECFEIVPSPMIIRALVMAIIMASTLPCSAPNPKLLYYNDACWISYSLDLKLELRKLGHYLLGLFDSHTISNFSRRHHCGLFHCKFTKEGLIKKYQFVKEMSAFTQR